VRFCFYDRVVEIEKGKRIVAVKAFALSEEQHRRHFRKAALVPGAILIETMAQVLGWLINYSHDFKLVAILSRLEHVELRSDLRPGFEATVEAEIIATSRGDSMGRATIVAGGEPIASLGRILYKHFHNVDPEELSGWFRYYSGLQDLSSERE
jgi:3-hydroxyacyl-[acyl-carrier-protein] dehydratase